MSESSTVYMPNPDQCSVAEELGIDSTDLLNTDIAVALIENKLGVNSIEVLARWFMMSVLRHVNRASWAEISENQMDHARQESLVKDCLAVPGFATSLKTVCKDNRTKYRLVGFASSKNLDRGVLSTATKAYKIAVQVLAEAGLVEERKSGNSKNKKVAVAASHVLADISQKTAVGRRAERRGYHGDDFMEVDEAISKSNREESMSKEEFADLEAALSRNDPEIAQQDWNYQSKEDRWSLILGLLAGVGFFVFVALLFL